MKEDLDRTCRDFKAARVKRYQFWTRNAVPGAYFRVFIEEGTQGFEGSTYGIYLDWAGMHSVSYEINIRIKACFVRGCYQPPGHYCLCHVCSGAGSV